MTTIPLPDPSLPFAFARLRAHTAHPGDMDICRRAGVTLPHQELTDAQLAKLKREAAFMVTALKKMHPDADESAIHQALGNVRPDLCQLIYDGMFGR